MRWRKSNRQNVGTEVVIPWCQVARRVSPRIRNHPYRNLWSGHGEPHMQRPWDRNKLNEFCREEKNWVWLEHSKGVENGRWWGQQNKWRLNNVKPRVSWEKLGFYTNHHWKLWIVLSLVLRPLKDQTLPYIYGFSFDSESWPDTPILFLAKSICEKHEGAPLCPCIPIPYLLGLINRFALNCFPQPKPTFVFAPIFCNQTRPCSASVPGL